MEDILNRIVAIRKEKIAKLGYNLGVDIPENRLSPVNIPAFGKGIIITEIKRGSPSEGKMKDIINVEEYAEKYINAGTDCISILTEEDFFLGRIEDLIRVRTKFPRIPILRKDFLLYPEEVEISYRMGADLILLIASILNFDVLETMIKEAERFGMLPIVEIHNEEEYKKISSLKLKLIGVNSRNLNDFKIDTNYPIGLRSHIKNSEFTVFESGIKTYSDAFFAGCGSYDAILVGTSIIKGDSVSEKIKELKSGLKNGINNRSKFYNVIFDKIYFGKKIVVKICGITNLKDAEFAVEKGADIIGFVFADSPRRISVEDAKVIAETIGEKALKVGVVVNNDIDKVVEGVREGWLDAIQFHGDTSEEDCLSYKVCWYRAIRVKDRKDFEKEFCCPITLYDAYSEKEYGGSGKLINDEKLLYANERNIPLYIAGGINCANVLDVIKKYKPLMIDVSSGLESRAGVKDFKKIEEFFNILNNF